MLPCQRCPHLCTAAAGRPAPARTAAAPHLWLPPGHRRLLAAAHAASWAGGAAAQTPQPWLQGMGARWEARKRGDGWSGAQHGRAAGQQTLLPGNDTASCRPAAEPTSWRLPLQLAHALLHPQRDDAADESGIVLQPGGGAVHACRGTCTALYCFCRETEQVVWGTMVDRQKGRATSGMRAQRAPTR